MKDKFVDQMIEGYTRIAQALLGTCFVPMLQICSKKYKTRIFVIYGIPEDMVCHRFGCRGCVLVAEGFGV